MSTATLGLGSNMGDRLAFLRSVTDELGGRIRAVSGVYETAPVGSAEPQQDYLNAVVIAEDDRDADGWLAWAQGRERVAARVRSTRWGPRTLDVDLLDVDGRRRDDAALTLPHPRAHERAFVLLPWAEADPTAIVPGYGPVAVLAAEVGSAGVRRCPGMVL